METTELLKSIVEMKEAAKFASATLPVLNAISSKLEVYQQRQVAAEARDKALKEENEKLQEENKRLKEENEVLNRTMSAMREHPDVRAKELERYLAQKADLDAKIRTLMPPEKPKEAEAENEEDQPKKKRTPKTNK